MQKHFSPWPKYDARPQQPRSRPVAERVNSVTVPIPELGDWWRRPDFKHAWQADPTFRHNVQEISREAREDKAGTLFEGRDAYGPVQGWAAVKNIFVPWLLNSAKGRERRNLAPETVTVAKGLLASIESVQWLNRR